MPRKTPSSADTRHKAAMDRLQKEMHAKMRAAKQRRGLLIVHTGDGKGKTTAAFGMLARMLGHGRRCAVVQFMKSRSDAVEKLLAGPLLQWHRVGDGFTWDTKDREADIAACRKGWELARGFIGAPGVDLLLLDELNGVLACGYLPLAEVLEGLRARRPDQHVVVTGRNAHADLVAMADLVTEMREVKHPFSAGVQAQPGIEY